MVDHQILESKYNILKRKPVLVVLKGQSKPEPLPSVSLGELRHERQNGLVVIPKRDIYEMKDQDAVEEKDWGEDGRNIRGFAAPESMHSAQLIKRLSNGRLDSNSRFGPRLEL